MAVKEICQEQKGTFDDDSMSFNPYIICFCKEGLSEKMWSNYAEENRGIQISVDADMLLKHSMSDHNPDVFVKCAYITEEESENNACVKSAINHIYAEYKIESDFQDDLQVCASCIKQKKFEYEKEYRYMIPHYNEFHVSLDKNGKAVFSEENENNKNIEVNGNQKYCHKYFPKEALVNVKLGYFTTDEQQEKVRQYLIDSGYDIGRICVEKVKKENLF